MTSRCPKCGKNNYGDVKKCSFCGSPLTFIPGVEIVPEITQDDIQEKMDKMKVQRIRNPFMIFLGGIIGIIGVVLMITLYLSIMLLVYSPGSVEPVYEGGAWSYDVKGGEQMIFGEITAVTVYEDTAWDEGVNHGYEEFTAYEINGDGDDNRVHAFREGNVNYESSVWIYSDTDLGEKGDWVLINVESRPNMFGEERAISPGFAAWGGHGFISGWIWIVPGLLIGLTGLIMFLIGIIGKADRSMERLLAEDKDLRHQQIMLREAARKQMEQKEQQRQWQNEPNMGEASPVGERSMVPEGQPQQAFITPQAGYPSQAPSEMPQEQVAQPPVAQPVPTQPQDQPQIAQQAPLQPQYQPPQ